MRLLLATLLAALVLAAAPTATAQSASEVSAARRLFRSGLAAARSGDWDEARTRFERSYAIAPRPNTLLNLAGAQAQTGRLVAASESYQEFLASDDDSTPGRYRDRAREALAALEPRLAQLTIEIANLGARDEVRLGDRALNHAVLGVALPVDPGQVDLVVVRDGVELIREPLSVDEGARFDVEFEVAAQVPSAAETASTGSRAGPSAPTGAFDPDPEPSEGGDDTALIVGILVGVGVAVAIGVTIGVVVGSEPPAPHQGDFGDGILEF